MSCFSASFFRPHTFLHDLHTVQKNMDRLSKEKSLNKIFFSFCMEFQMLLEQYWTYPYFLNCNLFGQISNLSHLTVKLKTSQKNRRYNFYFLVKDLQNSTCAKNRPRLEKPTSSFADSEKLFCNSSWSIPGYSCFLFFTCSSFYNHKIRFSTKGNRPLSSYQF